VKKTSQKVVVLLTLVFFVFQPPVFAAGDLTSKQKSTINSLFSAFASANPDKIFSARSKFTSKNSEANRFSEMIQNHFSNVQYYKGINAYGLPNNATVSLEPKGKVKTSGQKFSLDSSYNNFDFTASNFQFDSNGKIKSWSIESTNRKSVKLSSLLFSVLATDFSGGLKGSDGFVYIQPDSGVTVQIRVKNDTGGLKSWSFTGGQYGAPNLKWFPVETKPSGCLFPGQTAFVEAQLTETPQIVKGTGAVLELPMFDGCGPGSTKSSGLIRFTTN
jgi:hypothetical protein